MKVLSPICTDAGRQSLAPFQYITNTPNHRVFDLVMPERPLPILDCDKLIMHTPKHPSRCVPQGVPGTNPAGTGVSPCLGRAYRLMHDTNFPHR